MEVTKIFIGMSFLLGIFALALLYRVFKGPTKVDRLMAADGIDIILGVLAVVLGLLERNSIYIDLGLVIILLGFIGTVYLCKYFDGEV